MVKNTAGTTREKASAVRAAHQSAEKRRERTIRIAGASVVLLLVAVIIGLALFVPRLSGESANGNRVLPDVDPAAALPVGVLGPESDFAYAVPYGNAPDTAPTLAIWEDFQCPACAAVEAANGQGIKELATSGQVQLFIRPTAFLDRNLGNTASAEAVSAWGCAIDAGRTSEYYATVFANQPTEGAGYTTAELIDFGAQSGISGTDLDTFTQCVNDGTYLGWAVNSTAVFYEDGVPGTPTGYLNGQPVNGAQLADQSELLRLVNTAVQ